MSTVHDATEPAKRTLPVFAGWGRWMRALPLIFIIVGGLLLTSASSLRAAEEELTPLSKIPSDDEVTPLPNLTHDSPPRFNDVNGWRGSITATARPVPGTTSWIAGMAHKAGGPKAVWDFQLNAQFRVEFVLDEFESDPAVWTGKVTGSEYSGSYRYFLHLPDISHRDPNWKGYTEHEWTYEANGALDFGDDPTVKLKFHRERGWSVAMQRGRLATQVQSNYFYHIPPKEEQNPEHDFIVGRDFSRRESEKAAVTGMGSTDTFPYPAKVMVLLGQNEGKDGSFPASGGLGATPDVIWDYMVYLEPTSMDELRLVIEEPGDYASWRPETTPATAAGPALEVTARVETAKGGVPKTHVQQFVWELIQTSKEPGVAMNWPLEAKDTRFDLDLDATGGFFKLSNEKQKLERAVQQGFSDTVKVVPYDWGGWSTLQVTAIMTDGRRIRGKLKGKSETGLRVPKRDPQSHIADVWKSKKSGADDLDDEKIAGQTANGDGFSLYEEYRGWVVDGAYVGGEPEKKDFFVLNLIGSDAQAGLDMFAGITQFTVHDRLKPAEMSEEKRLMNGNRRQGAHVVDQHGVWIKIFASTSELGGSGALTKMTKAAAAGVAGRPGLVEGIGLLARTNAESDFNKPFNLAAQDMVSAFDRAVAHELLHSVGVEHHGESDYNMIVGYASTRNPVNKTGRPYYGTGMDKPIDLRTEEGEDVAQRDIADYEKNRQFLDMILLDRCLKEGAAYIQRNGASYNPLYSTPQAYADFQIEILGVFCMMNINGIVGTERGQHSGAEDCLMRYYFAKFYESKKPATIGSKQYYLIGEGTEHVGMAICHDKTGTGVNASDHKPQSRYGDAGNGDCFSQICPNDAVPPRSSK